jgi:hypothetical protein
MSPIDAPADQALFEHRDHPLLDGLNEPQRAAVTHAGAPLLVVAGAGSGTGPVTGAAPPAVVDSGGRAGHSAPDGVGVEEPGGTADGSTALSVVGFSVISSPGSAVDASDSAAHIGKSLRQWMRQDGRPPAGH